MHRFESIDQLRGFAIASMVLVNFLAFYPSAPEFLKHAKGNGFTFADLVAPLFLFAVGLVGRTSVLHWKEKLGTQGAYFRAIRRNLFLILIGIIGVMIATFDFHLSWGILQAIGLASLLALPMLQMRARYKVAYCAVISIAYLAGQERVSRIIASGDHGGPLGAFSWSMIVVLAAIVSGYLEPGKERRILQSLLKFSGLVAVAGLFFWIQVPFSKKLLTPSFIFVSVALCGLIFFLFYLSSDLLKVRIPALSEMGRNSLLLFFLHYLLVRAVRMAFPEDSAVSIVGGSLVVIGSCVAIACYLNRRRWYFKI